MGKLILVRHGESIWNLQNRFTGWIDISLSQKGFEQAASAGKYLKDLKFDKAFTSTLVRAQETLYKILESNDNMKERGFIRIPENQTNNWYSNYTKNADDSEFLDVFISEALNERYYGDLQGLNKEETAKKYGKEQVHIWRRSFDVAPPNGESLKMTSERTIPYFREKIEPLLKDGKTIIVAAHGNSLRSIVMHIEKLSPEQILQYEIGTGVPIVFEFDNNMKIMDKKVL